MKSQAEDAADEATSPEVEPEIDAAGQACARFSEKLGDPRLPTREEREEHEKHHLPYRTWCTHCVKGKCKEVAHRR